MMRKLCVLFFIAFVSTDGIAQILKSTIGYNISIGGKSLSYFNQPSTASSNINGIQGKNTLANFTSDSLVLEDYDEKNPKQIWLIEFHNESSILSTSYCETYKGSDFYFTIKNKASGKYLTKSEINLQGENKKVYLSNAAKNTVSASQKWIFFDNDAYKEFYIGRSTQFVLGHKDLRSDFMRSTFCYKPKSSTSQGYLFVDALMKTTEPYRTVTITPAKPVTKIVLTNQSNFCPSNLIHGDREFDTGNKYDLWGNLTEVKEMAINISVELTMKNNGKEIWAKIKFNARELGGDGTEVDQTWDRPVYTAPNGKQLKNFVSQPYFTLSSKTGLAATNFRNSNKYNCGDIIDYLDFVGDTIGNDVSDDDFCDNDTGINLIAFNPIFVMFEN